MQLVIAEKPSVASQIAEVLDAKGKKEGYLEGKDFLVSWCIGHLLELAEPEIYDPGLKKWEFESLPILPQEWKYNVKAGVGKQFMVLLKLLHDKRVDTIICATDAGREGELIFRLVYQKTRCTKPVKRLWLSSLEEHAIKEGFRQLRPASDYDDLYQSALCRQQADWLVGINATRLFTLLHEDGLLKIGRVQTPTLAMLVEREDQIRGFQKEKYYVAHVNAGGVDGASDKIRDIRQAREVCKKCKGKLVKVISVRKESIKQNPPSLYDLTSLQQDANRIYGYTANDTLGYLQSLYEKKLCTYPRTDSSYLSDDMEASAERMYRIVRGVYPFLQIEEVEPDLDRILDSRKVTDHHAIIPTMGIDRMKMEKLPEEQRNLLHLMSCRYLCAVNRPFLYEDVAIKLECEGIQFVTKGRNIVNAGWKEVYLTFRKLLTQGKDQEEENLSIPDLKEGMILGTADTKSNEHWTTPPKRYTDATLLSAMEKAGRDEMDEEVERKGLGTPATRAQIIEKLVNDGMVRRDRKQLVPTEKGINLIRQVPDVIKSPSLTAEWENDLLKVYNGELSKEAFMDAIRKMVTELVKSYESIYREKKENEMRERLGICPNCGADVLSGKYGAYCAEKCGMRLNRVRRAELSDAQVKELLNGRRIYLKNLPAKNGGTYSAYYVPEGIESFSYDGKDGRHYEGKQFKIRVEFPEED